MPISEVTNEDCMIMMGRYPDKFFDLAIVDPEYGIGISSNSFRQKHIKKDWDAKTPDIVYFSELFRVSKNQIIWGGNYFDLPPTQGFLIWDKVQPHDFSSAMCEYAWMSFQSPAKLFKAHVVTTENNKIHPTQKPAKLYTWVIKNYAEKGNKIIDTHLGSGSSRIAAYKLGFDFWATELDKDYFEAQEKRFKDAINEPFLQQIEQAKPQQLF